MHIHPTDKEVEVCIAHRHYECDVSQDYHENSGGGKPIMDDDELDSFCMAIKAGVSQHNMLWSYGENPEAREVL